MFESRIPALLCRTKKAWGEVADDYSYWRRVPEAEYDRWVDRCEALDDRIESCLSGDCFIIGDITYWRERAVEITLAQLSDKRLQSLQRLLSGRFRDWRIVLQLSSDLDGGDHLGTILIGRDFFAISRGLGRHFPLAVPRK
jgi:hypothetical protein